MSHNVSSHDDDHAVSPGTETKTGPETGSLDPEELRAQLDAIQSENQRLREQYAATRQQTYRRTALGLGGVGVLAALTGLLVTSAQQILFALAGIGLFAAVLTWFLTPEQFIPIDIGDAVYEPLAANLDAVAGELGLSKTRIYFETDRGSRVYVPERASTRLPSKLDSTFVIGDSPMDSGLALQPTGARLVDEFEQSHTGPLPESPRELTTHLIEGLVDGIELATNVDPDVAVDQDRIVFEITEPKLGPLSRFDHPVQSFLAVGLTRGLDTPVYIETIETGDEAARIVVRWDDSSASE
jgi:hypothetical protein